MKALQTRYLPPTNRLDARVRVSAWGVPSKTYTWGDADDVAENHKAAAVAFARLHSWIGPDESLRSGTLPNGDMCHVLPARRSTPVDKAKLQRLIAAANRVADLFDHCPDDETAAEAGLELERAAAAIGE